MSNALTAARRRTALILRGQELPACFLDATVESAINAFTRDTQSAKASRRRLAGLVVKIDERAGSEVGR
jgi:hypothetical protein